MNFSLDGVKFLKWKIIANTQQEYLSTRFITEKSFKETEWSPFQWYQLYIHVHQCMLKVES